MRADTQGYERDRGYGWLWITIALMMAVILAASFWPRGHDEAFQDYAAAGEALRGQLLERAESVDIAFNTAGFNPSTGPDDIVNNIMRSACAHTGDPMTGDHLVFAADYSFETTAVRQPDRSTNLNITVTADFRLTKSQERAFHAAFRRILNELSLDGRSDYEKARAIYDYICKNVRYDREHLNDSGYKLMFTAYAAAVKHTAVCSGVADLFYCLANAAGLDARIVTSDSHAWNCVRIDGRYYYLDATWDLGKRRYDYFLKGSGDFESRRGDIDIRALGPMNILGDSDRGYAFSETAYDARG